MTVAAFFHLCLLQFVLFFLLKLLLPSSSVHANPRIPGNVNGLLHGYLVGAQLIASMPDARNLSMSGVLAARLQLGNTGETIFPLALALVHEQAQEDGVLWFKFSMQFCRIDPDTGVPTHFTGEPGATIWSKLFAGGLAHEMQKMRHITHPNSIVLQRKYAAVVRYSPAAAVVELHRLPLFVEIGVLAKIDDKPLPQFVPVVYSMVVADCLSYALAAGYHHNVFLKLDQFHSYQFKTSLFHN